MKIAVASTGKDKNSNISKVAGRAPHYLIFDESGEILETISNPFSTGGGGAGYGVAKMLADKDVNTIVAGEFGPNMIEAMNERNLTYLTGTEKISDFILGISKKSTK